MYCVQQQAPRKPHSHLHQCIAVRLALVVRAASMGENSVVRSRPQTPKEKNVKTKRKLVDAVPIPVMPIRRHARRKDEQIINRLQMRNESRRGVKNVAENSTTARGPRPIQVHRKFQREAVGGLRHAGPWR